MHRKREREREERGKKKRENRPRTQSWRIARDTFSQTNVFYFTTAEMENLRDEYRKKYLILYLTNLFVKIIYIIKIDKNVQFIKYIYIYYMQ